MQATYQSYESHHIPDSYYNDNFIVNYQENCCNPLHMVADSQPVEEWRRSCGCLKTSQKLKQLLRNFPEPDQPPPPPVCTPEIYYHFQPRPIEHSCHEIQDLPPKPVIQCQHMQASRGTNWVTATKTADEAEPKTGWCNTWRLMQQVLSLLQLMVTASALAVYYLIYCYMQLIYFTLQSAIYFHNADPSMKVTIAVVTITSIILGINVIVRVEKIMGFH